MTEPTPSFWPDAKRRKAFYPIDEDCLHGTPASSTASSDTISPDKDKDQPSTVAAAKPTQHQKEEAASKRPSSKAHVQPAISSVSIPRLGQDHHWLYSDVRNAQIQEYVSALALAERITGTRRLSDLQNIVATMCHSSEELNDTRRSYLAERKIDKKHIPDLNVMKWLQNMVDKVSFLLCSLD